MADRRFIKAADTDVPVSRSKAALEDLLRRYGCTAFAVTQDFEVRRVEVRFMVPDTTAAGAPAVQVRLPIDVRQVHIALFGTKHVRDAVRHAQLDKAERVAWRNLILWVDAQLSAAAIGLQTVTEAFYAHAVIGPAGERAIDYVPTLMDTRQLGAGVE